MSEEINCWEFKRCGREPGGKEVSRLGLCPVVTADSSNGLNSGKNGGRICWAISGTICDYRVQGTFAKEQISCSSCNFFYLVTHEEGEKFCLLPPGQTQKRKAGREKQSPACCLK